MRLARANRTHNIAAGVLPPAARANVVFARADVLRPARVLPRARAHVVVANPPYVSRGGLARATARSVRNWEPWLALGGGDDGDRFYPLVESIARRVEARVLLVEVGGWEQAERVREAWAAGGRWEGVNVWLDYAGKGRGVVAWRGGWGWVKDGPTTVGG